MILSTWLLAATPAWAQSASDEPATEQEAREAQARELYRLGAGLYKAGRYKEAIGAFQEAHQLSGNEKLLFNIANAQERLGDLSGAAASLSAYRPHAPSADRVSLDLRIAALEERIASQPIASPAVPVPTAAVSENPPSVVLDPAPVRPRRPRWALVAGGGLAAAGFGAISFWSYDQGQAHREAGNQDAYGNTRTLNNVVLPLAGIGGGLAIVGLLPTKPGATVSAHPTGLRLRF